MSDQPKFEHQSHTGADGQPIKVKQWPAPEEKADPPGRLYHYCGLSALMGVIQCRAIWMTNAYWLDDKSESYFFREVVLRKLKEGSPDEAAWPESIRIFASELRNRPTTHLYVTSFSTDPNLLSQWLAYADNGHGYAIGFDPAALNLKRSRGLEIRLLPTIYTADEAAVDFVNFMLNEADKPIAVFKNIPAIHNLQWDSPRYKNSVFSSEHEWRLILSHDPDIYNDCDNGMCFHVRAGRHLVPHAEFKIDPAANPIREVWLGPRNKSERNAQAIYDLMRKNGFDPKQVRFMFSEIPLRPEY